MTTTTEEDTELRDLVAATLENSGVLGKIKAQLRANVYIALEEGNQGQECWKVQQFVIFMFLLCLLILFFSKYVNTLWCVDPTIDLLLIALMIVRMFT